jgi:hypothetical protein
VSKDFNFDLTKPIEAQASVDVQGPAPTGMKAEIPEAPSVERLSAARFQCLWRAKKFNLMDHPTSYFQDFAGPETSAWDAARCEWICQTLNILPGYQLQTEDRRNGPIERYSAREGAWILNGQRISIQEVRDLIDKRIEELGLSKVKLFEFMAAERSLEESREFLSLPFDQQMDLFREAVVEIVGVKHGR